MLINDTNISSEYYYYAEKRLQIKIKIFIVKPIYSSFHSKTKYIINTYHKYISQIQSNTYITLIYVFGALIIFFVFLLLF